MNPIRDSNDLIIAPTNPTLALGCQTKPLILIDPLPGNNGRHIETMWKKKHAQKPKTLKTKDIPGLAEYIKSNKCNNIALMVRVSIP